MKLPNTRRTAAFDYQFWATAACRSLASAKSHTGTRRGLLMTQAREDAERARKYFARMQESAR
jgi:hypothetical protein